MRVDFHVHTTASDGRFAPAHVLKLAVRAKLKLLSITDHDTVAGYDGAVEAARHDPEASRLTLVPGNELSTSHEGEELHILAYFPAAADGSGAGVPEGMRDFLRETQIERRERVVRGIENLNRLGVPLTYEEVRAQAAREGGGGADGTIGRAHMARALLAKGRVQSFGDAFARYLGSDKAIVPPSLNASVETIGTIRDLGGVPVWANPPIQALDRLVATFRAAGLAGLEVYSPRRKGAEKLYLEAVADAFSLVRSAGSDWHGHSRGGGGGSGPNGAPYYDLDGVAIGAERIRPFLERLGLKPPVAATTLPLPSGRGSG